MSRASSDRTDASVRCSPGVTPANIDAPRPPRSFHAQAEGVPRRVEEHPEGRAGLILVLGRAEIEHRLLGDVEVHLLGHLLTRPARRGVGVDLLEIDALAGVGPDLGPAG